MRITYIILLLTCFGMQSLAQTNPDSFNPAVTIAKIKKKSAIKMNTQDSINPDFEVVRGTHLVFEYEFKAKEYINMADDEMEERLIFEVLPKGNRFDFNTSSIKNSKLIYTLSCFCAERGNYVIKYGKISGRKVGKRTWDVQFNFTYFTRGSDTPKYKKFRAKFRTS